MPAIFCSVRYGSSTVCSSVTITQSMWKRALRDAWNAVGWHMFNRFVDKHFTKQGADEYRASNVAGSEPVYQARSGEGESGKQFWKSYNGRKQKKFGQQLAMVFSGNTRDGAKRATIYPTSNGVRVAMPGLVHLNQYKPPVKEYGPHAGEPSLDLRADVLAISSGEKEEMRAMHERFLVEWSSQKFLDNYIVNIQP